MTDEGLRDLLQKLPPRMDVMFDSYGGAISDVREDETAFVHRAGTISSVQYYMQWEKAEDTNARLATMKTFHEAMRPHMSGFAYFNYCDLDVKDYTQAYWGSNADRLSQIKTDHDPLNVFRHAQSIPLKK